MLYLVALGTLCGALMVSGCGDDGDTTTPPVVTVPPTSSYTESTDDAKSFNVHCSDVR